MKIGRLKIEGFAALAPMAGAADRAFRELCISYGAAFCVSEMVSAKALTMGDRKSRELMRLRKRERPAGIQLFGSVPEILAAAARLAGAEEPDFIDINSGCPAPKITGGGAGAALMRSPELAGQIVKAVCGAVPLPVTVKLRTGPDGGHKNAPELARLLEASGAAALTVHGRTAAQRYAPPVDFETIRRVREAVGIPVIANGDVTDGPSAARMLERTGCALVTVGRGALGRPWVFSQINAYLSEGRLLPEPPVPERMRVMVRHIEKICEYKGEKNGMLEARKHAVWYVRGIKGAAKYRAELCTLESLEQLKEAASRICAENEE